MKFTGDSLWKANNAGCIKFNHPFVLMIIHALVSACRQRPLVLFRLLFNHGCSIRYKGPFTRCDYVDGFYNKKLICTQKHLHQRLLLWHKPQWWGHFLKLSLTHRVNGQSDWHIFAIKTKQQPTTINKDDRVLYADIILLQRRYRIVGFLCFITILTTNQKGVHVCLYTVICIIWLFPPESHSVRSANIVLNVYQN